MKIDNYEKELAGQIFGKENLHNASNIISPFSMTLFCKNRRDQDFAGIGIDGISSRFCDEYYPSPTDVGFCMTKNMDLREIMHVKEVHSDFLNIRERSGNSTIQGGNRNAERTIVLVTDIFNDDWEANSFLVKK